MTENKHLTCEIAETMDFPNTFVGLEKDNFKGALQSVHTVVCLLYKIDFCIF